MQANMIEQTLKARWNGASYGVTLASLANNPLFEDENICYFFLRKELAVTAETWNAAKARGEIRHCKPYKQGYLDYVVRKEFPTLQAWVADAGGTNMNDVLYGTNRVNCTEWVLHGNEHVQRPRTPKYVGLSVLLHRLGYVPPPQVEIPVPRVDIDVEQLTAQMGQLMTERDLSINNVWVITNGTPVQWTTFVA